MVHMTKSNDGKVLDGWFPPTISRKCMYWTPIPRKPGNQLSRVSSFVRSYIACQPHIYHQVIVRLLGLRLCSEPRPSRYSANYGLCLWWGRVHYSTGNHNSWMDLPGTLPLKEQWKWWMVPQAQHQLFKMPVSLLPIFALKCSISQDTRLDRKKAVSVTPDKLLNLLQDN